MTKVEAQAVIGAEPAVNLWPQRPMTWSRHRAICRNGGVHKVGDDEYNWLEDL